MENRSGRPVWAALLFAVFMASFLWPAPGEAGKGLSFKKARDILYERSDAFKGATERVASKQEQMDSLKFLGGPTISAQALELWGETRIDVDKSISTPDGSMPVHINEHYNFSGPRASVTGTWPIFTGGKILATQKASKYAVEEARAQRDGVGIELDTELIAKYFGLQLAISIQKLREQSLKEQDKELARAVRFEREGMISPLERMGVQVARDAAERDLLKARDARRVAKLQLQRLLRDNAFGALSTPLFVLRHGLSPMSGWADMAVANNPQISAIEAKARQADQGVEMARSEWSPQIFAFGQYSFIRHYQTPIEPMWLAGLGINLTIWDARDRLSAFRSAKSVSREVRSAQSEAVNQIRAAAETAWLNTQNAREQYNLTASTVAMARENLRLKTRGFGEGLSTALDVTEARNQLLAAEVERRVAAYEFVVNYAMLHAICGKMDDFVASFDKNVIFLED